MSNLIRALLVLAALAGVAPVYAAPTTTTALPVDKTQPPPDVTSNGKTPSAAVKGSAMFLQFLHELGVDIKVLLSVAELNGEIVAALDQSGQAGVGVFVEMERVEGEATFYALVGDRVHFLGAGTSLLDVYSAYAQAKHLSWPLRENAKVDYAKSSLLWFHRKGASIVLDTTVALGMNAVVRQRMSDTALMEQENELSVTRALSRAVDVAIERNNDKRLKQKLRDLKDQREALKAQAQQIKQKLSEELERVRKAKVVFAQLSFISSAFTLAAQAAMVTQMMGPDTPKNLEDVKTPDDLQNLMKAMIKEAINNGDKLVIEQRKITDQQGNTRREMINVLRQAKYPTTSVPQLPLWGE